MINAGFNLLWNKVNILGVLNSDRVLKEGDILDGIKFRFWGLLGI